MHERLAARPASHRRIGTSPPGPLWCGSTTCSVSAGRDGGVERVAARLQRRHPGGGREPVRRGDHAERAGELRPRRHRHRERVQLDPVAVRVGHLDAHEAVAVLPLALGHRRRAQPLAGAAHLVPAVHLEAEVVAGRQPVRRRALGEREQLAAGRAEDQQVGVVVHALREPEVLAVERRGPLPVGDGEGDVVEPHRAIIAADPPGLRTRA